LRCHFRPNSAINTYAIKYNFFFPGPSNTKKLIQSNYVRLSSLHPRVLQIQIVVVNSLVVALRRSIDTAVLACGLFVVFAAHFVNFLLEALMK
jgi:hypothetical protein